MRRRDQALIGYDDDRGGPAVGWLHYALTRDSTGALLAGVTVATSVGFALMRQWEAAALPWLGFLLAILFAWTWWRITGTFFTFVRDYSRYN